MVRSCHAPAIALVLSLICVVTISCAGSSRQPGVESALPEPAGGQPGFPALADLPRDAAAIEGYVRAGREYLEDFPHNLVEAGVSNAFYSPIGSAQLEHMAYAGYFFNHLDATGAQQLQFEWTEPPVISAGDPQFWVGLSNWESGRWEWVAPADGTVLPIEVINPYIQAETGNMYVIVLVSGTTELVLRELGFPGLVEPDFGPRIRGIPSVGGRPGEEIHLDVSVYWVNPCTYSWNFGGGAEPNTSTTTWPFVTLGSEGVYDCNLTVSNEDGSDSFDFKLNVSDNLYFACGRLGTYMWPESGWVELTSAAGKACWYADSDGFILFNDLPNGDYTARLEGDNWVPDHIDFTINDSYFTELNFRKANTVDTRDIIGLIMGGGISSSNCTVQLTGDEVRTSTSGVHFWDLYDGNYTVTPESEYHIFYPPYRDVTIEGYSQDGISFIATTAGSFDLFTVSGTVTMDGSGVPAAGILIELKHVWRDYTVTDSAGYFEFTNIPPCIGYVDIEPIVSPEAASFYPFKRQPPDADSPDQNFVMTLEE